MIELLNVNFAYGDLQILKDFSLTVNDGECVQLCGTSGSGKTTVARLILSLETAQSGNVIAPQKISTVFQEDRLLDNLDVQTNIRLAITKDMFPVADNLLKEFNLYDVRHKKISALSGGMKRRVAIIRAVLFGGDALILDEAFNGLDSENKKIAAEIIKREFLQKNKPVLLITHINEDALLLNANTINI